MLIVYRAHNGMKSGSRLIGRLFFVPQIAGTPSVIWTADMLERELNAALWGNDLRYLAKFEVLQGVSYRMGRIAHDRYQGAERVKGPAGDVDISFDQYSYFRNDHLFIQVEIPTVTEVNWRTHLNLLADDAIKLGRLHGKTGQA